MAAKPKPTPVDAPRDFRVEEMFFSTTDPRGIITSGNEVFMRISGYSADELLGTAHNIIRHPDMPRSFYRLVWAVLKQGKPVAGYVKNLAADGRYYWVYAVLTPLRDGYLSVRFKPTGGTMAKVEHLYRQMRRAEREAADAGRDGNASMDAGDQQLNAGLQALGFRDYDAFMVATLHAELKCRDESLARQGRQMIPARLEAAGSPDGERMQAIYAQCLVTYTEINRLYIELDQYAGLQTDLLKRFQGVVDASSDFQLIAMNATIKSAHLGVEGQCIGVVAGQLAEISQQISLISADLTRRMDPVTAGLQAVILNLATARLQLEMIMLFCQELATASSRITQARDVEDLVASLEHTVRLVVDGLGSAQRGLHGFNSKADEMHRHTLTMQVVQIGGAVEASRLQDNDSLSQTFRDVRQKTDTSKATLQELTAVIEHFGRFAGTAPKIVHQIVSTVDTTKREIDAFLSLINREPAKGAVAWNAQPAVA